jgi:hypothetical protein
MSQCDGVTSEREPTPTRTVEPFKKTGGGGGGYNFEQRCRNLWKDSSVLRILRASKHTSNYTVLGFTQKCYRLHKPN